MPVLNNVIRVMIHALNDITYNTHVNLNVSDVRPTRQVYYLPHVCLTASKSGRKSHPVSIAITTWDSSQFILETSPKYILENGCLTFYLDQKSIAYSTLLT